MKDDEGVSGLALRRQILKLPPKRSAVGGQRRYIVRLVERIRALMSRMHLMSPCGMRAGEEAVRFPSEEVEAGDG